MPSTRSVPENKRRSRAGCLPCRRRHRKCDEKKPQCDSCTARRVTCQYNDWTFVSGRPSPASATARRYSSNTVRDQNENDQNDIEDDSGLSVVVDTPNSHGTPAPRSTGRPASVTASAFDDCGLHRADSDNYRHRGSASVSSETILAQRDATSSPITSADELRDSDDQIYFSHLVAILLHFRYKLASWMDSMAPRSTFTTELLELAHISRRLMDAIASLVAKHNTDLVASVQTWRRLHDIVSPSAAREPANSFPDAVADVTECLTSLHSFFGAPVSAWRGIASPSLLPESSRNDHDLVYVPQPLQTLLRLHVKIDLGNAIICRTVPRLGMPISTIVVMPNGVIAPQVYYDACLAQLAACLALCGKGPVAVDEARYSPGGVEILSREPHRPPTVASQQSWLLLWARCQTWFENRPLTMAPILATGGLLQAGTSVIEELTAAFPTEVYTSVLALQASIVTHLALALLLAYKPRLLKLTSHQPRLASKSWHAQKIAAIAVSNRFPEQWDPVVIAALLWVARDMTHPLQQQALLNCFREISIHVGIDLSEEMAQLHSHWQDFRQPNNHNRNTQ